MTTDSEETLYDLQMEHREVGSDRSPRKADYHLECYRKGLSAQRQSSWMLQSERAHYGLTDWKAIDKGYSIVGNQRIAA